MSDNEAEEEKPTAVSKLELKKIFINHVDTYIGKNVAKVSAFSIRLSFGKCFLLTDSIPIVVVLVKMCGWRAPARRRRRGRRERRGEKRRREQEREHLQHLRHREEQRGVQARSQY